MNTTDTIDLLCDDVAAAREGRLCPGCLGRTGIESNRQHAGHEGVTWAHHGPDGCGHQWDAADYELSDADECERLSFADDADWQPWALHQAHADFTGEDL